MKLTVFGVSYSSKVIPAGGELADDGLDVIDLEMRDRLTNVRLSTPDADLRPLPGAKSDGERRFVEERQANLFLVEPLGPVDVRDRDGRHGQRIGKHRRHLDHEKGAERIGRAGFPGGRERTEYPDGSMHFEVASDATIGAVPEGSRQPCARSSRRICQPVMSPKTPAIPLSTTPTACPGEEKPPNTVSTIASATSHATA